MSGKQARATRPAVAALCLTVALLSMLPSAAFADRWYEAERALGAADAGRQPDAARAAGAAWNRMVFLWNRIQPNGPGDWELERYIQSTGLRRGLDSGLPLMAVVQSTPPWAAGNPQDGSKAVPTGLDLPIDDSRNTFGQFVYRMASALKGRVGAWIIWNEPDFRPGDAGDWMNWAGSAEDLVKLVRTGYRAVKAADPSATVVFPATAYYPDVVNGRELFLARALREAAKLPDAAQNGYYFDAVALNLYCSIAGIYDIPKTYRAILSQHGLDKPLWLTETNCQPYNDATTPRPAVNGIATHEQAAFLLQAVAMARAADYERIGWYAMVDHDERTIPERWGLVRPDGSPRPAFQAFQVASRYLDYPGEARFLPLDGDARRHSWKVWRVTMDDPRWQRRVQVLWSGQGGPRTVRLPVRGPSARVLDVLGRDTPLQPQDGWWVVNLPPTRAPMPSDPPGFPALGDPVLLVEHGVSPLTPVGPVRVGTPSSAERFFAATGYSVEDDHIWGYYAGTGGRQRLGAPVSFAFPFMGSTVQLFERSAIALSPQGAPRLLDLTGAEYGPLRQLATARGVPRLNGQADGELALGSLLRGLLLGLDLPAEVLEQARGTRFLRQYQPDSPNFVARPRELPDTNLLDGF